MALGSVGCAAAALCALGLGMPARAAAPTTLTFQTHAAFFPGETKQAKVIDPQVVVQAAAGPAATGPQGIQHAAGFRPALVESDPASTPVFNADGNKRGLALGQWLASRGRVTLVALPAGGERVVVRLRGLRPNAQYSLFENHFDQTPVTFTPLDQAGLKNGFRTNRKGDGSAMVVAPSVLTHDNAVLVIYDSDGKTFPGFPAPGLTITAATGSPERFRLGRCAHSRRAARSNVFCFFFSKKKRLPSLI